MSRNICYSGHTSMIHVYPYVYSTRVGGMPIKKGVRISAPYNDFRIGAAG